MQRYLATRDVRAARRGVWLNAVLAFPVNLLFLSLGAALFVFFRHRPELLPVGMPNDLWAGDPLEMRTPVPARETCSTCFAKSHDACVMCWCAAVMSSDAV